MIRMIPDFSKCDRVNRLSVEAEVFFRRLWNKADDFGRYDARPLILKAELFPLKDVRTSDISRWLTVCETAGLLACYEVEGAKLLEIKNFGQRVRTSKSKYPVMIDGQMTDECLTDDGQPPDTCALEENRNKNRNKNRNILCASALEIYEAYPRKVAKPAAIRAIIGALDKTPLEELLAKTNAYASAVAQWNDDEKQFIPHPATWFNQERYNDDPATWAKKGGANGQRQQRGTNPEDHAKGF